MNMNANASMNSSMNSSINSSTAVASAIPPSHMHHAAQLSFSPSGKGQAMLPPRTDPRSTLVQGGVQVVEVHAAGRPAPDASFFVTTGEEGQQQQQQQGQGQGAGNNYRL
jgi:hypothetical protein